MNTVQLIRTTFLGLLVLSTVISPTVAQAAAGETVQIKPVKIEGGYAVVVSKGTQDDPDWGAVVNALVSKYGAKVVVHEGDVTEAVEPLRRIFPRYACFVARPEEAGRAFVVKVHRMTRKLDEDPYTDVLWGILTGYGAADALRMVAANQPLIVRKAAGGCPIDLTMLDEGIWYSEGEKHAYFEKKPGGPVEKKRCPADTTKALVDVMNQFRPDLFVTSGHATERDWQIGYSYRNGQFRCKDGVLFGRDMKGNTYPIHSGNPKVYAPWGNCLMGHVRDRQSMALAWMHSGGVNQMIGYVVGQWYPYGGRGVLDYFVKQPGRYTFSEAFYFNNQALIHALQTRFPETAQVELKQWNLMTGMLLLGMTAGALNGKENKDARDNLGLLWDRDTVAFYGDPAWDARLAPRDLPLELTLTVEQDTYTFQVHAKRDHKLRHPPAHLLPHRIKDVQFIEGRELAPLITDNFIMLPELETFEKGKTYRVVFRAKKAVGWIKEDLQTPQPSFRQCE